MNKGPLTMQRNHVAVLVLIPICAMAGLIRLSIGKFKYDTVNEDETPFPMRMVKNYASEYVESSNDSIKITTETRPYPLDCTKPIVTIDNFGNIGNQFIMYTGLLSLRYKYDVQVAIPEDLHQGLSTLFKDLSIPILREGCGASPWTTGCIMDLYSLLSTQEGSLQNSFHINEYMNEVALTIDYRNQIRKEFLFKDEFLDQAKKLKQEAILKYVDLYEHAGEELVAENVSLICVHVKRQDYTTSIKDIHPNAPTLSFEYFERAFQYMRDSYGFPAFAITSDDMPWCQKNLYGIDKFMSGDGQLSEPGADLALMATQCDHTITSYGTFSQMAATFARGIVIYPIGISTHPLKSEMDYESLENPLFVPISVWKTVLYKKIIYDAE